MEPVVGMKIHLRKLANAFEISPIDLFAQRRKRTDNIDSNVSMPEKSDVELKGTNRSGCGRYSIKSITI